MEQAVVHNAEVSISGAVAERIDVMKPHEVRYWAHRLGVTQETLCEAVRCVGNDAQRVARHVKVRS